jgi:nucleoid-associated protein YgaU
MFAHTLTARILLLALLVLALWALFARSSGAAGEAGNYRVKPGDTLWSIAASVYRGGDPREGVWKLTKANHLGSTTLAVDQVLVVPA